MFAVALAAHHVLDQIPLLPQADFVTPTTLISQSLSATSSSSWWHTNSPLLSKGDDPLTTHRHSEEEKTDFFDKEYITVPIYDGYSNIDVQVEVKEIQSKVPTTNGILSDLALGLSTKIWYTTSDPDAENALGMTLLNKMKSWLEKITSTWQAKYQGPRSSRRYGTIQQESLSRPDGIVDRVGHDDVRSSSTHSTLRFTKHNDTSFGTIPSYVLEYAPLVHLFSGEQFWPCDIAEHLTHVTPQLNYTPIQSEFQHLKLSELDHLNKWPPHWVYLTSDDDPEKHPDWLEGVKNIPVIPDDKDDQFLDNDGWVHHPGRTYMQGLKDSIRDLKEWYNNEDQFDDSDGTMTESHLHKASHRKHIGQLSQYLRAEKQRHIEDESPPGRIRGGRSDAPAVLIVVDKGAGVVDAFWFFFYSFNLGNSVFNIRFGNHVGDWEHTAVRFHNGTPQAVFFSEHSFGSVYSYEAVEKLGKRPVTYSATGTHAMYATPGLHPYILPLGILHDQTDRGPLWDPLLNAHTYTYNHTADVFKPSTITPDAPIGWLNFAGRWGDMIYPLGDDRQYGFAGQYHYVSGPRGPKDKQLGRTQICAGPEAIPCVIKNWLPGPSRVQRWHGNGDDFVQPPDV